MRILFDHQAFSLQNTGGITRSFYELVRHLSQVDGVHPETLLGFSSTAWPMREASRPNGKLMHWGKRVFSGGMPTYALNELLLNPVALCRGPFDLYHNTLYRFMPGVRARRYIATHHDCVQERFPELFPDAARIIAAKRKMFRKADRVLCVSESSRADLESFYGVEPGRCTVIYNGVSPMIRSEDGAVELARAIAQPFLLYVGIRASYKNFDGFLKAFAHSGLQSTYRLLVLGGGAFSHHEHRLVRALSLEDRIVSVPFASPGLLAEAYAQTRLLVYPSFYEGFGLPPLEAMQSGTPVLVAASPATTEVCGDAALYFDPQSPEDFIHQLKAALQDEPARRDMVAKGLEHVRKYRWDATVEQTLQVYRSLI